MSHTLRCPVLLSPDDTQKMDVVAKQDLRKLMHNAGLMVARAIRKKVSPCRVVVACGPGNNGGDGYVVAQYLQQWGWSVSVAQYGSMKEASLAFDVAQEWRGVRVPFLPEEAQRAELVVDAVFGAGFKRTLPGEVSSFFRLARRIVAIDVPSGVDGLTGQCRGDVALCEVTVALIAKRPGHLLHPAKSRCGCVHEVDIGMPEKAFHVVEPRIFENSPLLWSVPEALAGDHKYKRGVVSVCSGEYMPGAALLAGEAARRVGAGMVRILARPSMAQLYNIQSAGCIVDTVPLCEAIKDLRREVWTVGPGMVDAEVSEVLPLLIENDKRILVDAGALAWGAHDRNRLRGVSVMTPHEGEFVRLFGAITCRLKDVCDAALDMKSVIVLKGDDTIIASPDGRVALNSNASPVLATAGSGDVLSGVISALMAAGMSSWEASCAGVWVHSEAGRRAAYQYGGWIVAEDINAFLGYARQASRQKK